MKEIVERLNNAVKELQNQLLLLEKEKLTLNESSSLSEQIKETEALIEKLNKHNMNIGERFNDISNIIVSEINTTLNSKLAQLRQQYLLEETDTPREAYVNLVRAMEYAPENDLLLSVKKFLESQLPPTEEVLEDIPFEVAKIVDSTLKDGDEVVEIEGVNGSVKIIYEIIDGEKKEFSREIVTQPVTKVVRVHAL